MNEPNPYRGGVSRARRTPEEMAAYSGNGSPDRVRRSPQNPPAQAQNRNRPAYPDAGARSGNAYRSGASRSADGRGGAERRTPSQAAGLNAGRGLAVPGGGRTAGREQRTIERYEERKLTQWKRQEREESAWQRGIVRVKSGVDRPLLILVLVLLSLGSITVLSASYPLAVRKDYGALYYAVRQGIFVVLGLIMMVLGWKIPYEHRVMRRLIPIGVWTFAAVCLLIVLKSSVGISEGQAQRWIQIPGVPVTIQPSEIMKIGEVMLLAMYADVMKKRMADAVSPGSQYLYNVVLPGLLVGVSCGLVIIGRHLSGTMIIGLIGLFMILVMGDRKCRPWWAPVTIVALLAVAAVAYIIIVPYARDRFTRIFSPDSDRWQSMQSLYAVGSGGLFGVGVGQSRQKYSYLGAAHTDFIFAIWCEEFGFVGAAVLIVLFFSFLWRGYRVASRAKDSFSMLTAFGITTHFAVQIIGHMVVDTTYMNTGISLPFFSYGGSSLIMQMYEVGLLLRISQHDYRSRAELEEADMRRRAGLD